MQLSRKFRTEEKGATIVVAALCMTIMLGMAAISVDYAQGVDQKRRLQNAADAAAVSQAEKCALYQAPVSASNPAIVYGSQCAAVPNSTDSLIVDNAGSGVNVTMAAPNTGTKSTSITTSTTVTQRLGRALHKGTSQAAATATATWSQVPISGTPVIPMAISYCDWLKRQPPSSNPFGAAENTYEFGSISTWTGADSCTSPWGGSVKAVSDKMVWLTSTFLINTCAGDISLGNIYVDFLGSVIPIGFTASGCQTKFNSLSKTPGNSNNVVLIPLYTQSNVWGFTSGIQIVGYAPFQITDFRYFLKLFGLSFDTGSISSCSLASFTVLYSSLGCGGIRGKFIRTTRPFDGWTYGTSADFTAGSTVYNWNTLIRPADRGAVKIKLTN